MPVSQAFPIGEVIRRACWSTRYCLGIKKLEYRSGLCLGLAAEANAPTLLFDQVFCHPEAKPCSYYSFCN